MRTRFLIITLFICVANTAQIPESFPRLSEDNLENASFNSERTYTAESLFGYMNGGAELYLEYGFDRLVVSEIDISGNEFKVEVYRMDDPEAAFGIYSVSVFRCDTSGHINDYSCQTDYQLQFCRGHYYVSIINTSGSREAFEKSIVIARELSSQVDEKSFVITDFLHGIPFDDEVFKATLIKGELGLYNGAYDWNDFLEGFTGYIALLVESKDQAVLSLKFSDESLHTDFLEKQGISSQPPVNDEINIGQNTMLSVNYDNIIMIRRQQ